MTAKLICSAALALSVLAACGEVDIILPGERSDIRENTATQNEVRPIGLPAARVNPDWTHRNGGPDHAISHPALSAVPVALFAVDIGEGDSRRARITADPVVSGGVIYTLDARSLVTATSVNGALLWQRALTTGSDNLGDASGGGVSVAGNRVYATTGFGRVTAIEASSGAVLWTQDLDAPGGASPTAFGDLVYIASRDSTGWALEADTGRIRWQLSGTPSISSFGGGAGVAVNDEVAIFPFSSGEVLAAFPQGGLQRWSAVIGGERLGSAAATITDIAGDPVISGGRAYVGNVSGRIVALDASNGDRIWTATEGAVSPVWPVGGSVFAINDIGQLVRIDDADGSVIWRVELPGAIERRFRGTNARVAHYGPVLAGGRLIVASSDGLIRQFDPTSGALIGSIEIPGGAASNPVVAGQTLYVVSKTGQLHAFR